MKRRLRKNNRHYRLVRLLADLEVLGTVRPPEKEREHWAKMYLSVFGVADDRYAEIAGPEAARFLEEWNIGRQKRLAAVA